MKGEVFHRQRAVTVSVIGLVLQSAMTVAMLVLGVYADAAVDGGESAEAGVGSGAGHAAITTGAISAIGLIAWVALIVLFDLKRRERIEAFEAERLSQDEVASAFEGTGEDLNVAARRLAWAERIGMPIVGVLLAALLLTVGLIRFRDAQPLTEVGAFDADAMRGWMMAGGAGVAMVGLLFARFLSGMAVQRVWSALRAGATYMVATLIGGGVLAAAHFVDLLVQQDAIVRYAPVVIAAVPILMGVETVANLVLDLYRPRTAGEEPRPAFDSRLMGLLAAPDRIVANVGEALNYQFGVNVSGSWFYNLLRRWWLALVGLAALSMWAMTALVVVEPHQRALILANGQVSAQVGPGLHLKWPWPFGQTYIPETLVRGPEGETVRSLTAQGVRRVQLGTNPPREDRALLWSNDHTLNEIFNLVQPTELDDEGAVPTDGADLALVAAQVVMHYVVDDVEAYDRFAAPGHRDRLIKALGERELTLMLGSRTIDQVLAEKNEIADALRDRLESLYGERAGLGPGLPDRTGIDILYVGTGMAHPPKDVVPSFERVIQARQSREATIESARTDRDRALTAVAGSVDAAAGIVELIDRLQLLRDQDADPTEITTVELEIDRRLESSGGGAGARLARASADRWTRHMGERGSAALYQGRVQSYRAAPGLFITREYLSALRDAMERSRVYWVGSDHEGVNFVLDLHSTETNTQIFDVQTEGASGPREPVQ